MTGTVAALGFLPMMLSTGIGAEVQRPLATVVFFGMVCDTFLTMLALPVLYLLFGEGPEQLRAEATTHESNGAVMVGREPRRSEAAVPRDLERSRDDEAPCSLGGLSASPSPRRRGRAGSRPGDARRRHRHPVEGPEGAGEGPDEHAIWAPRPGPGSAVPGQPGRGRARLGEPPGGAASRTSDAGNATCSPPRAPKGRAVGRRGAARIAPPATAPGRGHADLRAARGARGRRRGPARRAHPRHGD